MARIACDRGHSKEVRLEICWTKEFYVAHIAIGHLRITLFRLGCIEKLLLRKIWRKLVQDNFKTCIGRNCRRMMRIEGKYSQPDLNIQALV